VPSTRSFRAWMQDQGTPRANIALFMLVAVLGGFAFQIPVVASPTGSFNAIVALFAVALIMVTTARAEPPRVSASRPSASNRRGVRRQGKPATSACGGSGSHLVILDLTERT
jgi:hypothetical protein